MMADFPYTPNPASIGKFLEHIQSAGKPEKVTQRYLVSVGFKSTNDRYLIAVMKAIDLLDRGGVPTKRWRDYRDRGRARAVLADGIRHGYSDLFTTYSDAFRKDNEALHNFFSAHSDLSETTLSKAVQTFKALCSQADFDVATPAEPAHLEASDPEIATAAPAVPAVSGPAAPAININIQLHLPPAEDASVYEKLFAAMKKHLFPNGNST